MNTSELETLIRNILSEQLAPAKAEVKGNGIFRPLAKRSMPLIRLFCVTSNVH